MKSREFLSYKVKAKKLIEKFENLLGDDLPEEFRYAMLSNAALICVDEIINSETEIKDFMHCDNDTSVCDFSLGYLEKVREEIKNIQ